MVIFVGDRPSPRMKPGAKPFEGASCEKRLKNWIKELDIKEYRISNQSEIRKDMMWVVKRLSEIYPIIALGNNASKALKDVPHFKLPHPSGRNRLLNDPNYIKIKLKECKKWLEGQS